MKEFEWLFYIEKLFLENSSLPLLISITNSTEFVVSFFILCPNFRSVWEVSSNGANKPWKL